jgi:hypothetical protein
VTTVRIRSGLSRRGRAYRFADLADLPPTELLHLIEINRRAQRVRSGGFLANRRLSRELGQAVAVLLPDLEPRVARRLPDHERVRILRLWAALTVGGEGVTHRV